MRVCAARRYPRSSLLRSAEVLSMIRPVLLSWSLLEDERKFLGHTHRPDVVQSPDQHRGAHSQLIQSDLRGGNECSIAFPGALSNWLATRTAMSPIHLQESRAGLADTLRSPLSATLISGSLPITGTSTMKTVGFLYDLRPEPVNRARLPPHPAVRKKQPSRIRRRQTPRATQRDGIERGGEDAWASCSNLRLSTVASLNRGNGCGNLRTSEFLRGQRRRYPQPFDLFGILADRLRAVVRSESPSPWPQSS